MPRPRKFVNARGKKTTVNTGVSLHEKSGRFYILDKAGNRTYFGTFEEARASLAIAEARAFPPISFEISDDDMWSGPPLEELPPDGTPLDEIGDDHPHKLWLIDRQSGIPPTKTIQIPADGFWLEAKRQLETDSKGFIDRLGLRRFFDPTVVAKGQGPTLRKVGEAWKAYQADQHGGETRHIREQISRWESFVRSANNVRVDVLTPEHFREYFDAVARKSKGKSAKMHHDRCAAPKSILTWAKKRYPEYGISRDALDWADSFDRRKYKAKRSIRQPVTPEGFTALIAQCRAWQQIDPEKIDVSTVSGRGKKHQATLKRRDGHQLEAILTLSLNCALDNVDIERIEWDHLIVEGDTPRMDFERRKAERLVGQPVPRVTPLLAETVAALQRWRGFENRTVGRVFRSARKSSYTRSHLARTFQRLKQDAGLNRGLTFKAFRNAAPTVAYRKLGRAEYADMILGHEVSSEARKYIGDVEDPQTLRPLVDAIQAEYFKPKQ